MGWNGSIPGFGVLAAIVAGVDDHPLRPLLFLDVDGTLLPYGAPPPSGLAEWDLWQSAANPQLAKLVPAHGARLLALGCDLVWATAWMDDANDVVAPRLGLPRLPVADLPDAPEEDEPDVLHWKTSALVAAAGGRAFAWVDDEIGDLDRQWVEANHPGRALLLRVDGRTGLTDADFAVLDTWARA
ncbi:HAD domain-containing protein [Nonomuraea longicatena]|uniref:HAD domain-containing protein n=1 Tax=Nonomuraea longicatena TaxID=83682 RepID=A0ABP4AHZ9_9ACTN